MIKIYDAKGRKLKSIPDDDFFNHLTIGELMEDHPEWDQKHWNFTLFSPQNVKFLYHTLQPERLMPTLTEAYLHDLSVLEISCGDFDKPLWVPITSDLVVSGLKKCWYLDWCKAQGYTIKGGTHITVDEYILLLGYKKIAGRLYHS